MKKEKKVISSLAVFGAVFALSGFLVDSLIYPREGVALGTGDTRKEKQQKVKNDFALKSLEIGQLKIELDNIDVSIEEGTENILQTQLTWKGKKAEPLNTVADFLTIEQEGEQFIVSQKKDIKLKNSKHANLKLAILVPHSLKIKNTLIKTASGDVKILGSLAIHNDLKIKTLSGDVDITTDRSTNTSLLINTSTGDIQNARRDFKGTMHEGEWVGTIGDAKNSVKIATQSGDIKVN